LFVEEDVDILADVPFVVEVGMAKKSKWTRGAWCLWSMLHMWSSMYGGGDLPITINTF
jgi:hypothetical protein